MRTEKSILLVEDDLIDVMSFKRALRDIKAAIQLDIVNDGEEALEFLRDKRRKKPAIIILDLNMPRMNGLEFLKAAKNDATIKTIPVIILTSSEDKRDKVESFGLGAAGYILKRTDYNQFIEAMKTIDQYWTLSELPN